MHFRHRPVLRALLRRSSSRTPRRISPHRNKNRQVGPNRAHQPGLLRATCTPQLTGKLLPLVAVDFLCALSAPTAASPALNLSAFLLARHHHRFYQCSSAFISGDSTSSHSLPHPNTRTHPTITRIPNWIPLSCSSMPLSPIGLI